MFERTTRILSEGLARSMDRRDFMKRASQTVFGSMAALAAGHAVPRLAMAGAAPGASVTRPNPVVPVCSPPGPYCNMNGVNEPNGCHGGSCYQHMSGGQVYQCRVYYQYYQAGCWTTAASGGYWTCCDCQCTNGSTCGCAQFNGSPAPRPDGVGGSVGA